MAAGVYTVALALLAFDGVMPKSMQIVGDKDENGRLLRFTLNHILFRSGSLGNDFHGLWRWTTCEFVLWRLLLVSDVGVHRL
jgi:hypothetical protein